MAGLLSLGSIQPKQEQKITVENKVGEGHNDSAMGYTDKQSTKSTTFVFKQYLQMILHWRQLSSCDFYKLKSVFLLLNIHRGEKAY